jgi:hypothetical protein
MSSFIYFYSKFTEEFLLLGGAAIFTLLAAYCYHWVIKRRRLGAARSQVPSGVVKAYLNQLIQEAQFVRTQLFGLVGGEVDPSKIQNLFLKPQFEPGAVPGASLSGSETSAAFQAMPQATGSVPTDLLERLKALESQLAQKESLVVNINVEKTKLLEEIENLKQNQKALQNSSAMSAGQDELLKKIKNLEERLEEYSLFEDDLANLKRLQQENTALKKRLEETGAPSSTVIAASAPEPIVETVIPATPRAAVAPAMDPVESAPKKAALDQDTIDSLLEGVSPIAPNIETTAPEASEPSIDPVTPSAAPNNVAELKPKADDFEKLVDSVEDSLVAKAAAQAATPASSATPNPANTGPTQAQPETASTTAAPATTQANANPAATASTVAANTAQAAPAKSASPTGSASPISEKSDEELLKEFENLLNS